jgi:hypothetical protein
MSELDHKQKEERAHHVRFNPESGH